MSTLDDYKKAVASAHELLAVALGGGSADAFGIAIRRVACEGMDQEIKRGPQEVVSKWEFAAAREKVHGPTLWQMDWARRAAKELRPFEPTEAEILRKDSEYRTAMQQLLPQLNVKTHTTGHCDIQYFIEENPIVQHVKDEFRAAVQDWMLTQRYEPAFYQRSAIVGLATVLEQRQDIVVALRAAQEMGAGSVSAFPIDVPLWKEGLAFMASLTPYLGNAITLVEAYEGRDLFCRKLGTIERVLMVALIAVPAATKIAKAGKAVYTATRMSRLYGRDAAKWTQMILMGERATAHPAVRRAVIQAAAAVRAQQALDAAAVKEAEKALAILIGKGAPPAAAASTTTRQALLDALGKLGASKPALAELDQLALNRVVQAAQTRSGPSVALAKAQLLEEFKETRTVKLLREQFAAKALGLDPAGARAEYFAGHMLSDARGAKLTDGIVGTRLPKSKIKPEWYGQRTPEEISRIQGVIRPLAVDETKAGRASSKSLGYKYDVTDSDLAALKAVAQKRFQKLQALAAKEGKPVGTTIEAVEKQVASEYKLGEIGGQARSTIERLDQNADGSLPSIFFGDDEYLVHVPSVTRVKIFGVLPRDVPAAGLTRRLQAEGLNFEVLGINITREELEKLAAEVLSVAAGVR